MTSDVTVTGGNFRNFNAVCDITIFVCFFAC